MKGVSSSVKGSAIILVLSLVTSMTLLAVSFLLSISRIKGSMRALAHKTKTVVALEAGVDHAIKSMLLERADPSRTYSTKTESIWVTEFAHVDDPDGNPFTEDGTFVRKNPSNNDLVNAYTFYDGDDMIGFPAGYDGRSRKRGIEYRPRWHNLEYLDDYYKLIQIDNSLDESDKAALRGSARYVVRYCVDVMDLGGQRKITHNWPNPPTDQTSDDYLRFQNYLKNYGVSIKSIYSISSEFELGKAYRSNDPNFSTVERLDWEPTYVFADGTRSMDLSGNVRNLNVSLKDSGRIAAEMIFRGESFKWGDSHNDLDQLYPTLSKGRAITHAQLAFRFKPGVFDHGGDDAFFWFPVGETLQDSALGGDDEVSCPWSVNLLTAADNTIQRMVGALSSHYKWGVDFRKIKIGEAYKGRDATRNNSDLMGPDYPEAFPLGVDEGRDVPLVGRRHPFNSMHYKGGMNRLGVPFSYRATYTPGGDGQGFLHPAYQDSYWCDVLVAVYTGLGYAYHVWADGVDYGAKSGHYETTGDPMDNWYLFHHNNAINSYIWAARDEDDPEKMIDAIIMDICRILGEGYIDTASNPAVSQNYFDHSLPGLLAGGVNHIGFGGYVNDKATSGMKARRAQLSPNTNTRAMEYVLNDVLISLFGRARPGWRLNGDLSGANLENIAVDFNGDGYAESTVTGWHDAYANQRVWSWYWHGLGPYTDVDSGLEYMRTPNWYRFYEDGRIQRKNGGNWENISDVVRFRQLNDIWLTGNVDHPIKPFSKTGRIRIGKSQVFEAFIRAEVYNLVSRKVQAVSHRAITYKVDPDRDNDFSDSYLITQKDFTLVLPELE